jgi:molybdopterin converting factor small subunit
VGVTISLHKTHRRYTDGKETINVEGETVRECLKHLTELYPTIKGAIFTDRGKLNSLVEVYINAESAYPDELKKPVKDGDVIHLIYTLAGG